MEWGFALAIIGVILVLISTTWYFASYWNQLHTIAAKGSNPVDGTTTHSQTACTVPVIAASVPATGDNISLKEALAITAFPYLSVGGWLTGAALIIGGTIWGLISRSRAKPDSTLSNIVNSILQREQVAPQAVAPAPPAAPARAVPASPPRVTSPSALTDLTPAQVNKLKELLGSA